jgi:rod shape determining protein RodA
MSTTPVRTSPIQPPSEPSAALPARGGPSLRLDPWLLLAVAGLLACSIYTLQGATQDDVPGSPNYYVYRQLGYGLVGLVLMFVVSRFDYSRLRELKYGVYGFMIASILLVLALGGATRGSKRWIDIGVVRFQPSELGKVLLIVALAAFMVDRSRRLRDRDTTAQIMLLALVPAMLVISQPDLGTGLVYIVIAFTVLFVAGTSWKHFVALAALGAVAMTLVLVAAPAAGVHVLKPYQVDRLTAFLNPSDNPRDEGYQQNQSRIAIGSGERTGRGEAHATQTRLNFLPEHHTDFVFAVVGETYGFIGAALVLSLYALVIWRGLRILTMAKNLYGAIIAGGITAMLMFQVFVNAGMTIGIMPITGVPLPLMSYGPASVIVTFLAIGLLQSIHAQAKDVATRKSRALIA